MVEISEVDIDQEVRISDVGSNTCEFHRHGFIS